MTEVRPPNAGVPTATDSDVPRVHIVGRKNAGKTTLVCDLVRELSQLGYRVATVKHTHHQHELDTPGKDSHRHRVSGAVGVGILSPRMTAAFVPVTRADDDANRYASFSVMFSDCDLILVEGDLNSPAARVEVWRQGLSEPPYAIEDHSITALVSDDAVAVTCQQWKRSDIREIAHAVVLLTGIG